MQERESYNGVVLPVKRLRELDTHTSLNLRASTQSRVSTKKNLPQKALREFSKIDFQSEISQSGEAKAFWYFHNLGAVLDASKDQLLTTAWFQTGDKEQWNLLLWPYKNPHSSGLYVQLDLDPSNYQYRRAAHIRLQIYITKSSKLEPLVDFSLSEHFTSSRLDWGFDDFLDHTKLQAYLHKPLLIEATVVSMSSHESSKSLTSYVGLINEGTTCYVNSLLQTLYFLTAFRKAVYQMPTTSADTDKLPISLQLIFYHLQFAATAASTRDLLLSFGWSSDQWNTQHDVQEFNCILAETLEGKMKGTASEGVYARMFTGKMKNSIVCEEVDFKSCRTESFSEVQLNVKGCRNIYESFDRYVESEELKGDNQYEAGEFGKQNARKEVGFEALPPVLQIQLKRFEYDPCTDSMAKVNDRFEFYEEIDLGKYVEEAADCRYLLFSILVHTGTAAGGHYFAYISPRLDGNWYKFNDDSVDKARSSQALESNFGGETVSLEVSDTEILKETISRSDRSAYMLVYIHAASVASVLEEVATVPQQLHEIYEAEVKRKALEDQEKLQRNSSFHINLLSRDMILGWDKPGITPPEGSLYPTPSFSETPCKFRLKIPKHYKGKDLRAHLAAHIIGEYRLWTFTPGYRNWEFKELKLNDSLETELSHKALFIDVDDDRGIFKREDTEWRFENTREVHTDSSLDTEITDECFELQTPSHAKAIVTYKWYDWNKGQPTLTLFKLATLTSTASMAQIRSDLCTHWQNSSENLQKMILHLEKCKITYTKNKEQVNHIHTYKLEDNYELTISKRGSFGVRHVMIDNGDVFIGEVPPDVQPDNYIDAKRYISNICDEVQVLCLHYNKFQNFGYESFGESVLQRTEEQQSGGLGSGNAGEIQEGNMNKRFVLSTKLSYCQTQIMGQIAERFRGTGVGVDQIQLYVFKNGVATPVPMPATEEEIRIKKSTPPSVGSILENESSIHFDILPFPLQVINNRNVVYVWQLDKDFNKIKQCYAVLRPNGTIRELDKEIKNQGVQGNLEYFLLSFPQFAIVKELEMNNLCSVWANNPWYVLGMKESQRDNMDIGKVLYK